MGIDLSSIVPIHTRITFLSMLLSEMHKVMNLLETLNAMQLLNARAFLKAWTAISHAMGEITTLIKLLEKYECLNKCEQKK